MRNSFVGLTVTCYVFALRTSSQYERCLLMHSSRSSAVDRDAMTLIWHDLRLTKNTYLSFLFFAVWYFTISRLIVSSYFC